MANKPNIRFEGFTDDWEQRKLGDQMYIKSRIGWQALTRDEYLEAGDYYLITGTDIDESSHTVDLKRCYYVSKERYEMDDKIQVREGDIIVTKDGTIGKVAMVTGLDKPATLNSHLFVLRDLSGNLDNRYLLQMLNSHIFDAFVNSTKTGSTLTGLPQKTFVEFQFPVPSFEEQKRVSGFFDNLDNLITLHQRKCDETKELKKYMLQNMFPKNSEKKPEIRFAGFNDNWEQRKFGDMFERRMERNGGQFDNTRWISVAKMYFQEPDKVTSNNIDTRTYVMRKGDIAFEGHPNSDFKYGRFVENDIGDGVISELFPIYRHIDNYDLNYWKYAIQLERIMQKIFVQCIEISYTSSNKLDEQSFLKESILVPTIEEQKKIGEYFKELDNHITLLQRKCDDLNELKKYMLQNMFPTKG